MNFKIKKSNLTFLVLFLVNLLVSVLAFFVLPDKFFNDAEVIVKDIYNQEGFIGSYPFAIFFYKYTFLKYLPYPLIGFFQYIILIYIIYKIGVPKNFHILNVRNILVYIGFFMLAIFVSMPSKEFITFVVVSTIPIVYSNPNKSIKFKVIYSLILLALFSFYRSYFLFIPIISIGMYFFTFLKLKNKAFLSIIFGVFISILISIVIASIEGTYITESTREMVNEIRGNTSEAQSKFVSPVEPNTWYGESISIIYGFLAVNIPIIETFKHILKPQIIVFIIWQLFLFYILLKKLSKSLKNKEKYKLELWILLILFSYYIVQALFEPDLASAVRHKMGFFPLIYYVFYYENFKRKV
ncbi:hypothetical protein [Flavobacterium sp.]|jgi:hypothetical protein|uniref:hypothetical protein n=1 Tax=Flavobacterium sp. TaxID=239 RepID=UPI0037C094B1